MLRRFLVLGVALAALLWTLAPSDLQAQHGGRGGGFRSSFSGVGRQFNRTGTFSRSGGFNRGFDRRFAGLRFDGFNRGFDRRFFGFGFGGFSPGLDWRFSGFGFGTGFDPRFFSPTFGRFGPVFASPLSPRTDSFGGPLSGF
jgi:hypothetical protein